MGSDESHLMFQWEAMDKFIRHASANHNLFEEKGVAEAVSNRGPSAYQHNVLPLGQTTHDHRTAYDDRELSSRLTEFACDSTWVNSFL